MEIKQKICDRCAMLIPEGEESQLRVGIKIFDLCPECAEKYLLRDGIATNRFRLEELKNGELAKLITDSMMPCSICLLNLDNRDCGKINDGGPFCVQGVEDWLNSDKHPEVLTELIKLD